MKNITLLVWIKPWKWICVNCKQSYWIQLSQTGGQLYSGTSPLWVNISSLLKHFRSFLRRLIWKSNTNDLHDTDPPAPVINVTRRFLLVMRNAIQLVILQPPRPINRARMWYTVVIENRLPTSWKASLSLSASGYLEWKMFLPTVKRRNRNQAKLFAANVGALCIATAHEKVVPKHYSSSLYDSK